MDDDLTVTGSVRIPRHELQVSFSASGGPGGQHANKSATRVELRFDIANSTAQRRRVIERMGNELRVVVDDERSQLRNRALAEERLVARLQSALHVERPRRPTRPTKGSRNRRLKAKQHRGQIKQQRRRPNADD